MATESNAIVECLSSASAITVIFELFLSSFGYNHCVMSLSYSLYMAASIFLLHVQAVKPPDSKSLERLDFCVNALERVSSTNAGTFHFSSNFGSPQN
jgi:hypothetical protein